MQVEQVVSYLDDPQAAAKWLSKLGVQDARRAHAHLLAMAEAGVTIDLLAIICEQLTEHLPRTSDADMALANLRRFVAAARNPIALGALFERDREALPILLQMFSTSQHFSDLLVRDPECYDLLRLTEGQPVARDLLVADITSEVAALAGEQSVMLALRRYKHRETLRIAYGDIIRGQKIETVTRQISYVADAVCEAALQSAFKKFEQKRGTPRRHDGHPARIVIIALGRLGGCELNYSSHIDLFFLYETDGQTDGKRPITNHDFFQQVAREAVKLLTEHTELGVAYRVELDQRPEGSQSPITISVDRALHYYDVQGSTWERQALVKARPAAGDLELGREFIEQVMPWVYKRYLSRAEITGIKALKRRLEQRAGRDSDVHDVKAGRGGIRDIEFAIQFLQLLNGGDLPAIRTGNTMEAIVALEGAGCITMQERSLLEENYALLRKIEHRLQIMFDLETHALPESEAELRKLAIRMGFKGAEGADALHDFRTSFQSTTELNRKILDHLLHDAFRDEEEIEPEIDLVLDPDPPRQFVEGILGRHGFQDITSAYRNLTALATEAIPFLSTRRCTHFLASIAPRLLAAISETPDPDFTLVNLSRVSESLGGKAALWELFSFHPASLKLYVRLCAASPYLSDILTSNPGMIDELLDSLLLDRLPDFSTLETTLAELCRRAEDVDPILHSFKNSQHLHVGVRDILGKEDIRNTHRALSDIAEVCVRQVARHEYERLAERFGVPTIGRGLLEGRPCELIILAMGKLGGREPNYHSDIDVVFLYDAAGMTKHRRPQRSTSNQHFFSQLGQRITIVLSRLGPHGRLYEVDSRLRPNGRMGALAVSLDELARYFSTGQGQLWERQALCKARPIYGSADAAERIMNVVRGAILEPPWRANYANQIFEMRKRLQETASPRNLKRGAGGTMDVEFAVQMLQLKHVAESPAILVPGTLDAIESLHEAGHLQTDDADYLAEAYRFLRSVEARLRLMNTTALHDVPMEPGELKKLAFLFSYDNPDALRADIQRYTAENRRLLERLVREAAADSA